MACETCNKKSSLLKQAANSMKTAGNFVGANANFILGKNDLLAKERLTTCQTCPNKNENYIENQAGLLFLSGLQSARPNFLQEINNIQNSENPTFIDTNTIQSSCSLCGCPLILRSFIEKDSFEYNKQKTEGCLWQQ